MTIMDVVVEEEEVRSRGILNQTRLGGEGGYKKKSWQRTRIDEAKDEGKRGRRRRRRGRHKHGVSYRDRDHAVICLSLSTAHKRAETAGKKNSEAFSLFVLFLRIVLIFLLSADVGETLTTVEFVAGFWAVDMAVAAALHRDARAVLARELAFRTLGPLFIVRSLCIHRSISRTYSYY